MPIDIDKSFYNTGMATVSNGGTTVSGLGTLWLQSLRAGDLFGTHVGAGVRIASIVSNTQLTLAHPWQGASQTAAAYEVQLTPYDVGYQQAVRELLTALSSGNLEAFGELAGSADKVPYFTGPGAMALLDLATLGGGGGEGGWDALVGTLAGRNAFNGEAAGFRVMVADNGNGQAVIYEKLAVGWSVPVPFTGPTGNNGPVNTLEVGSVTSGEVAYVNIRGTAPNQIVDFVLQPGPMGDVTPEALAAKAAAELAATNAGLSAGAAASMADLTAADRVATGQDRVATGDDRIATGQDRTATNADKVATAADRVATGQDRTATDADKVATADDRVATGADRLASASSATAAGAAKDAAATSATNASTANSAAQSAKDAAETARDKAHDWAQAGEGVPVDDGVHTGYSSYHWSKIAETAAGGGILSVNGKTGSEVTLDAADVGATPASKVADIDANTGARHTHSNKAVLDGMQQSFTTALKTKLDGINLALYQTLSLKGVANGYPGLDSTGKVPTAQLPDAVLGALKYQGTWNAATNSPAIPAASAANKGWYYMVQTAGSTAVNGTNDWEVGDWIVSNGARWDKIDNTDAVNSVAGLTGSISTLALQAALGLGTAAYQATGAFATAGHTHAAATGSVNGFMSAADKTKLDTVTSGANPTNITTVGAAIAAPTASGSIADGDKVGGVFSGGATLAAWTWGTVKAWIKGWITKADVGLGNVSNLTPANMPVSTATQTALNEKVIKAGDSGLMGFTSTDFNIGDALTGPVKPLITNGNFQSGNKAGAMTLQAPDIAVGQSASMRLRLHNSNGTGTITFTGFAFIKGEYSNVAGLHHYFYMDLNNGIKTLQIVSSA